VLTKLPLLLPLLAALAYVAGALLVKRAGDLGANIWQIVRACNFASALIFVPLSLLGGTIPSWELLWQPALVALLFFVGQILSLFALKVGDVSVTTPVLGIKIPLVALLLTVLIGERIGPVLWAAAFLSCAAIVLLNFTRGEPHHRIGFTIFLAVLAAASYALFDVLVQKWSPAWGAGRFLPIMMVFVALFSLPLQALGKYSNPSLDAPSASAGKWLAGGAACFALQVGMFVSSIALYGNAAVANVLYSSRGLWSVLAVWLVGHWFANRERHYAPRVLAWRFVGAVLLMAAIAIFLLNARHNLHSTSDARI